MSTHAQPFAAIVALVVFGTVAGGCIEGEPEQLPVTVAGLDSVLSELGGVPTASLSRAQRWRMISSVGVGLPPTGFRREDLPEPRSRGSGLVQAYCVQCHWFPDPQMHSVAEWPLLVRRMMMRARTLKDRLGGPLTSRLMSEILIAGLARAELPAPAEVDSLVSYLQRNALPAARPGEYAEGPGAELAVETCSICHELPSPSAHTAAGWEELVPRMRANMEMMDVEPITDEQSDIIVEYLKGHAAR